MSAAAQALEELLAQVQALRSGATQHPDPVRLHYVQALARRLQAAPPALQTVLQSKLVEALKALGGGAEAAVPVHHEAVEESVPTSARRITQAKAPYEAAPPPAPLSQLGQLNHYIHTASKQAGTDQSPSAGLTPTQPQDLKSAVRFRETWARISAETAVDQATNRAPENAGPLNAHNLVLRTLGLMRELSPDYLRRFLGHAESLLWLDQAYGQLKQPAGKGRAVKAGPKKK
jgi:hypothetical protein